MKAVHAKPPAATEGLRKKLNYTATVGESGHGVNDALPLFEAEAAERKKKLSGTRSNAGEKKNEVAEKIPQREPDSRTKAAAVVGVNPRYVQDAKAIKEKSPETFGCQHVSQILARVLAQIERQR